MRKVVLPLAVAVVALLAAPSVARAKGGPSLGKISGVVVTESGETAGGVTVSLAMDGDPELTVTRTNRKGRFRFDKLAPGAYTVTAIKGFKGVAPGVFLPEFIGTVDLQLEAGEHQNLVVVLLPCE